MTKQRFFISFQGDLCAPATTVFFFPASNGYSSEPSVPIHVGVVFGSGFFSPKIALMATTSRFQPATRSDGSEHRDSRRCIQRMNRTRGIFPFIGGNPGRSSGFPGNLAQA